MSTAFTVRFRYTGRFQGNPGYAFYGALCARLGEELAAGLHLQEEPLLHQYVVLRSENVDSEWRLFTFAEKMSNGVRDALKKMDAFEVRGIPVTVISVGEQDLPDAGAINIYAEKRFGTCRQYQFTFHSATTFKQAGNHVIVPSVFLIYQSLINRFGKITGQEGDEDALRLLVDGTHISAYKLESSYYPMKTGAIAGFCGKMTLSLNLAEPLRLYARDLFMLGEQIGMGAKTTLGMGGYSVESAARTPIGHKNSGSFAQP